MTYHAAVMVNAMSPKDKTERVMQFRFWRELVSQAPDIYRITRATDIPGWNLILECKVEDSWELHDRQRHTILETGIVMIGYTIQPYADNGAHFT